ncbi:response regulator [Psychromarinibacter sediminicola]|uniref:response regulator n=1 Tax=Psychromarinibacter sediminicola TaxID=3033385 RepID=UPI0035AB9313
MLNKVIAILDDDAAVRALLKEILEAENYEVIPASTVQEFRVIMRERAVDLFIIDVILPESNGLQVAQDIRRTSDVGIIVLTGQKTEIDTVLGLEIGADDYVTKPFRVRELRARVKSVIRRSEPRPPDRIARLHDQGLATGPHEIGGWRLDVGRKRILSPEGILVDLSESEFSAFVVLLQARGRTVSREKLLAELRGTDWSAGERLVDGIISRLRKKLATTGRPSPIRTVRGIGYASILSQTDDFG